jgi:hypothetical protein
MVPPLDPAEQRVACQLGKEGDMDWLLLVVTLVSDPASGISMALGSQPVEAGPQAVRTTATGGGRLVQALYQKMVTAIVRPAVPMPVNRYTPDPNVRMEQLLFESEDIGQIRDEVRRFWMNDQPSPMTYQRIKGGIGP